MGLFTIFAVLISLTALLSYLNERFLRLPPTIGVMAAALLLSLVLAVAGQFGVALSQWAESLLREIDFGEVLMNGMLSYLLFAGSLHVDLESLISRKWTILTLSTVGVVISTFAVGTVMYFVLSWIGVGLTYVQALLFGALISPTDPIAVLGVLRKAGAPKSLESMIIGESLFNDGVGVVVFTVILAVSGGGHAVTPLGIGKLLLVEALGGVVLGLVLGWTAFLLLRSVDQHVVELLITLALVSGGYALAGALHASGPIAMVVAGLFIGNHGRVLGMSADSRANIDTFWELIDEILNAVLFVMIGLEVLVLEARATFLAAGALAVPLILAVRFGCVSLPVAVLRRLGPVAPGAARLMTWGGIRGGISIALALALPASGARDLILVVTYVVVVFSILVQGLTVGRVVRRIVPGV